LDRTHLPYERKSHLNKWRVKWRKEQDVSFQTKFPLAQNGFWEQAKVRKLV